MNNITKESLTPRLCGCGCGRITNIASRAFADRGIKKGDYYHFIHGHQPHPPYKASDEARAKISNALFGKKHSAEWIRNSRLALTGIKRSPEQCMRISQMLTGNKYRLGKPVSEESKQKNRESHLGKKHSEEAKRKISEAGIGKVRRPAGWKTTDETKKKLSDMSRGVKKTPEHCQKMSATMKKRWQDPIFCEKMGKSWGVKPNKPEMFLLNLLESLYPGQWKYTGDFSFIINGKSPDFTNCNGQKKVIEFNGTYWHRDDVPGKREATFAEFGYKTLIIWDQELNNIPDTVEKIREFHEAA